MKLNLAIVGAVLASSLLVSGNADAQSNANVRDHRTSSTVVRDHRVKAVPLSPSECTQLGGDVRNDTSGGVCSSGKYCRRTGKDGSVFRVCISSFSSATQNAPKSAPKPANPRPANRAPMSPTQGKVVAVPLTVAECTGLGGVIRQTDECGETKTTCVTTDGHGVIRTACINKMSK
nr:hypothetical protein [uncultured Cohaesibacter sp.]